MSESGPASGGSKRSSRGFEPKVSRVAVVDASPPARRSERRRAAAGLASWRPLVALAVLLMIPVGLGGLTFLAWRERTGRLELERKLEDARRENLLADRSLRSALDAVSASLLRAADESFAAVPDVLGQRAELLQHAGDLLAQLASVGAEKPELLRSLAETQRRAGDLERVAGGFDRAGEFYAKAAERLRTLALRGQATAADRIALAECLYAEGALKVAVRRDLGGAAQLIEDATATLASVRDPGEKRRIESLRGRYRAGRAEVDLAAGETSEAELRLGAAVDDLGRLQRRNPDDPEIAANLFTALGLLWEIRLADGRGAEAAELLDRAEKLVDGMHDRRPRHPTVRLRRIRVLDGRARSAEADGEAEAARSARRRMVDEGRALERDFPEYAPYRIPLATALAALAAALVDIDQAEAGKSADEACTLLCGTPDQAFAPLVRNHQSKLEVGGAFKRLAAVCLTLGSREGTVEAKRGAARRRQALAIVAKAFDGGFADGLGLDVDPAWAALRDEPAFQAILTKLKASR